MKKLTSKSILFCLLLSLGFSTMPVQASQGWGSWLGKHWGKVAVVSTFVLGAGLLAAYKYWTFRQKEAADQKRREDERKQDQARREAEERAEKDKEEKERYDREQKKEQAKVFWAAATAGNLERVKQLADVVDQAQKGVALAEAASTGHIEVAEFLSPMVDLQDRNKGLVTASFCGHTRLVSYLLDQRAGINAQYRGGTALTKATVQGNAEVVSLLLKSKADVTIQDTIDHMTALSIARKNVKEYCREVRDWNRQYIDTLTLLEAAQPGATAPATSAALMSASSSSSSSSSSCAVSSSPSHYSGAAGTK